MKLEQLRHHESIIRSRQRGPAPQVQNARLAKKFNPRPLKMSFRKGLAPSAARPMASPVPVSKRVGGNPCQSCSGLSRWKAAISPRHCRLVPVLAESGQAGDGDGLRLGRDLAPVVVAPAQSRSLPIERREAPAQWPCPSSPSPLWASTCPEGQIAPAERFEARRIKGGGGHTR